MYLTGTTWKILEGKKIQSLKSKKLSCKKFAIRFGGNFKVRWTSQAPAWARLANITCLTLPHVTQPGHIENYVN